MKRAVGRLHTGMPSQPEMIRFVINGLFATAVHFAVLTIGIEIVHLPSAAIANFVAALAGISVSFLGNRYFVFHEHTGTVTGQAARFAGLYFAIAALHAGFMYLWADLYGFDYRFGFVVATAMQVMLSYTGNRFLVFSR